MNRARTFLTAASVAALLAGCNSNVDGGTVAFAPESFSEIPANSSVTIAGKSRVLSLTAIGEGVENFSVDEGTNPELVDTTFTIGVDGEKAINSLRIVAADIDLDRTLDEANATLIATEVATTLADPLIANGIAVMANAGDFAIEAASGFDGVAYKYQQFGRWSRATSATSVDLGSFTGGFETASAGAPTSGKMSYEGVSDGNLVTGQGNLYRIASNLSMSVDFGEAQSFTFQTTNSRAIVGADSFPASSSDLTGGGALAGSSMSGAAGNAYFTGTVDAQLYGPAADEVGGTFAVSGPIAGDYVGSFGGAAVPGPL